MKIDLGPPPAPLKQLQQKNKIPLKALRRAALLFVAQALWEFENEYNTFVDKAFSAVITSLLIILSMQ